MKQSSLRYKGSCADSLHVNITNAITMLYDYYNQKKVLVVFARRVRSQ